MESNIKGIALLIEGGAMRASMTSGFCNALLEEGLYFDYVAGISAGSSCAVNYLSRDPQRMHRSFVAFAQDPNFGGWGSFWRGEGFFRAHYIYEQTARADQALPFDFETFQKNPADFRIGAFHTVSGTLRYFRRSDVKSLEDLMKIVRASSSMPILMPPGEVRGEKYLDGGLGGGIPLDIAKEDGYERFFVLLSRPKAYWKKPPKTPKVLERLLREDPLAAQALKGRHLKYNAIKEELLQLEQKGQALLVFPQTPPVKNRERNLEKLEAAYEAGLSQGRSEMARWMNFLQRGHR
ncbi:hypothetical protein ABB02_00297 [Clostridiaceae bacterium JG1575]|nr:hypothetical protein ABB02_00297 [Clostridiaceae bacterium JG1575]